MEIQKQKKTRSEWNRSELYENAFEFCLCKQFADSHYIDLNKMKYEQITHSAAIAVA